MVEGAPLLREYTRKGIEGSNPFLSAISPENPDPCQKISCVEPQAVLGLFDRFPLDALVPGHRCVLYRAGIG